MSITSVQSQDYNINEEHWICIFPLHLKILKFVEASRRKQISLGNSILTYFLFSSIESAVKSSSQTWHCKRRKIRTLEALHECIEYLFQPLEEFCLQGFRAFQRHYSRDRIKHDVNRGRVHYCGDKNAYFNFYLSMKRGLTQIEKNSVPPLR